MSAYNIFLWFMVYEIDMLIKTSFIYFYIIIIDITFCICIACLRKRAGESVFEPVLPERRIIFPY